MEAERRGKLKDDSQVWPQQVEVWPDQGGVTLGSVGPVWGQSLPQSRLP